MVTWIPSIYTLYVSIYSSTMDPMGYGPLVFSVTRDAIWRRMILPAWLSGISSACRGGSDESVCGENAGARCEAVRSDEGIGRKTGGSNVGDTPHIWTMGPIGWLSLDGDFFMEHPKMKWMITGGSPMT